MVVYFVGVKQNSPGIFSFSKEEAHEFIYHDDAQQIAELVNRLPISYRGNLTAVVKKEIVIRNDSTIAIYIVQSNENN